MAMLAVACAARGAKADEPPPAHVGFQMALRTGYSLPMGELVEGTAMTEIYAWQVPVLVEVGGKLSPHWFVAAYLGAGIGAASQHENSLCSRSYDVDCVASSVRFGAEIQYHISPAGRLNPWFGYGIGPSSATIAISDSENGDVNVSQAGWEYAHLMGGIDIRLSRAFGVGAFVDLALGEYTRFETELEIEGTIHHLDIDGSALHEWLTLGVRGVLFP